MERCGSNIRIITVSLFFLAFGIMSGARERQGRWEGDFSLNGGTNFISGREQFDVPLTKSISEFSSKVGYISDKWTLGFDLGSSFNYAITTTDAITFNIQDSDHYSIYGDENIRESYNEVVNIGVSSTIKPSDKNFFSVYYRFKYNFEKPARTVESVSFNQDTPEEDIKFHLTLEESLINKMTHNFGGSWTHNFDNSSKLLNVKLDASFAHDAKHTEWMMGEEEEEEGEYSYLIDRWYRETPDYLTQNVGLKSFYLDKSFVGVKGLEAEFGLDAFYKQNFDDLKAATKDGEEWVDSLSFKEQFDYLTITLDPKVRLSYRLWKFGFSAEYCPEYYAYRLSSEKYFGSMSADKLAHLTSLGISFSPSEHHTVRLNARTTIKRPTYLNLCWFRRSGTYANEFYEGNQELRPETSNRLDLSYNFKWKRFSVTASIGNIYAYDKVEKTFYNEDVGGQSCRIYTWINAGWGNTLTGSLSTRWSGRSLFVELSGKINEVFNVTNSGKESRNMDYRLDGQMSYKLKTWMFAVKGNYQSEIIRMYSSMTQYVGLSARVDKQLGHFSVFAEGRDLLDRPIETETYSEDFSHGRLEESYNTRRVYLLGVRYKF